MNKPKYKVWDIVTCKLAWWYMVPHRIIKVSIIDLSLFKLVLYKLVWPLHQLITRRECNIYPNISLYEEQ